MTNGPYLPDFMYILVISKYSSYMQLQCVGVLLSGDEERPCVISLYFCFMSVTVMQCYPNLQA